MKTQLAYAYMHHWTDVLFEFIFTESSTIVI